jgi:hypothetical protein
MVGATRTSMSAAARVPTHINLQRLGARGSAAALAPAPASGLPPPIAMPAAICSASSAARCRRFVAASTASGAGGQGSARAISGAAGAADGGAAAMMGDPLHDFT